jgi:ribonuclease P protein subunit RPR2
MGKAYKKKKFQDVAASRIEELFAMIDRLYSDKEFSVLSSEQKQKFANRYVELARTIAMKHTILIPEEHKRKFCKHCYAYLRHGENVRVRLQTGKLVYYCLSCKKFMRRPLHARNNLKTTK